MMNKGLSIIGFVLLMACSGDPSPKEVDVSTEEAISEQEDKSSVSQFTYLTNENCVEFLQNYGEKNLENRIKIETKYGAIEVKLYDDTPLHRANFIYLIKRNYFNPTEIVRVVKGFVVQGGNSEKEVPSQKRFIIGDYTLPSEIRPGHFHKRGALALSRSYENNPEKKSAPYDFYFVHGSTAGPMAIKDVQDKKVFVHSSKQIEHYKTKGGAIHLDGEHTVFGEITKGIGVIDKIAALETDASDWPNEYVEIKMSIVK